MNTRPSNAPCAATLNERDLQMFERIGVSSDLLEAAHIERVTDRDARERFGMKGPVSRSMAGIVFPYISHVTGRRVTARVRRDDVEIEDGKPKNKYVSAYGDGRHLYFPPGAGDKLQEPITPIVLVEAEKSALALSAWARRTGTDVLPVALGGCWGWRGRIGKIQGANGSSVDVTGPVPDLNACDGRTVYLMLDSNVSTNSKVQEARNALARELLRRRCSVRLCNLPEAPGVNGPDDFIATHGDSEMDKVFASADVDAARTQDRNRNEAEAQQPAVRRGYLRMPHSVLQRGPILGPYGLAVALVLADHADAQGICWPSVKRIMQVSGIGAQATVLKALEKLRDLDVIETKKIRRGFITKHVYRFIGWNGEPASATPPDEAAPFHQMPLNKNHRTRTKENIMGGESVSSSLSKASSQQPIQSPNTVEVPDSPIHSSCPSDSPDETAMEPSADVNAAFIEGEL